MQFLSVHSNTWYHIVHLLTDGQQMSSHLPELQRGRGIEFPEVCQPQSFSHGRWGEHRGEKGKEKIEEEMSYHRPVDTDHEGAK